ncbi:MULTISPECIES: NADH-quinone oxidoreductase subunit L [unclassified Bosea (in: a-proteobacteria)]|uniref:NADH-quinone oxidoreductase subunit L n=1 Tax=unclassified Bosea (in: a-proteobacteria) TaxID=2653178 RepID=UPI000F753815|nr:MULTISPECIES: NADH-quinone oxidoreductase subunit L [unclassified Bosea (in: a-proteobacteria)]AZO77423.1 NADH-quinone oxidoreductase subunit L [Bosea sp. Tri-49]RXT22282.1 NADH-quinone oxidoreductase subunit L [Bosea sp. Tri-39]RXT32624.1 NADH-quinone oxidoreductase subunit L [Bosea sp. Tri-54]
MYQAIVFLPLIGFFIAGIFGRLIGARASEIVTTTLLLVSAVLSWIALFQVGFGSGTTRVQVATWLASADLRVDWAFRIDTLTAVMLVVVNTVSSLVHVYSIGYMHEDPSRPRFFAYLSLFTFAMLMLVTADNLVQMFFGWEGVGLASYLLIGFWYQKPSANAAAIKAFVVNRVGDFGFLLGIFLVFVLTGSVAFDSIFPQIAGLTERSFRFLGYDWNALTLTALLLFMGAMGKSAQFMLHTWLPDAMEGPTPVSALIHAATMVTAGVFMVARLSPIFEYAPVALTVVVVIGATTAFFAATVGLVQNDIKRVIAYSTCSQLGYMFVAMGVGAYSAGIFHLFTHAFFKALLFLGAGSVIHAMHHEQDMRNMGGLRKHIPWTAAAMTIGTLALTGVGIPGTVFGFAGFFSKDAIIESAYAAKGVAGGYAFPLLVVAALMTSFYSWRLYFMTFEGKPRWAGHGHDAHGHDDHAHGAHGHHDDHAHSHDDRGHGHDHKPHESPLVMLIPLAVLSLGAVAAGFAFKEAFVGHDYEHFWKAALFTGKDNHILHAMHEVPKWVVASPFVAMLTGFALAWYMYVRRPDVPGKLAAANPVLYKFLLNKWYFDEIYDFLFVKPAMWLGRFLWKKGDGFVIDGMGPDGVSARVVDVTNRVVRLQTGYVYHYAFAMLIGVAGLVTWYLMARG